jgi:transposase
MEKRRMRGADLFRRGTIPAEIARQLGVSHQVVSEWRKVWRQAGRAALRGAGHAGRRPKLSGAQLAKVEKALTRGAEANGYVADVWTLLRVAEVIERLTGVTYHPAMSGTSCATSCAGAGSGRLVRRSSATTQPSSSGSNSAGRT